jgi:di/tricarboxylate transporter
VEKDGRTGPVAGSYARVVSRPQGLDGLFVSPAKGFVAAAMIIAIVFGTFIGVLAGYYRRLDGPLMRLTDMFLALPLMNIMTAQDVAKEYYSPILFLILGGAFLALTIERTGMHRRVALAILAKSGHSVTGLMIAFMGSTALLSMVMSNTSIALIMVPIAIAVLAAGGTKPGETDGLAGALIMGVAFAASIGGKRFANPLCSASATEGTSQAGADFVVSASFACLICFLLISRRYTSTT